MAGAQEKWYFTKVQLQNSPSRKCGLDADKELAYRQQAANLIQDMGQRLQVSQLCINTAIVYMHRFYAFHSFTQFHRNAIAAAALFLAAKVEEQPRKLEYVIKVAHVCLHRGESVNALTPEQYQEQAQDLVFNENVLLQTLGFDVAIDHPHTHVVRTCHLVKAPKDLAQTSYFMASNSLHLTTMCLQYRPTIVACFCIHLASKWSNWAIPQSNEGRHWFSYVDRDVTTEMLERLTSEFLHIFDKCPSRLKRKMMTMSNSGSSPHAGSSFDKKHSLANSDEIDKSFDKEYERERRRQQAPGGYVPATAPQAAQPQKIDFNLYREKREREERERREDRERRQQALQQRPAPQNRPNNNPPPHNRPPHKPPHPWPHKPPHNKPPDRHRQIPSTSHPINPTPNPPVHTEVRTRPPSLFSPENATTPTAAAAAPRRSNPPQRPRPEPRPSVSAAQPPNVPNIPHIPQPVPQEKPISPHKKRPDPTAVVRDMQPPAILSPFSSPREKQRPRLNSNSEPELVPVVKKIDETPGYENVVRESQRGNAVKTRAPDRKPEARALNGIETDPTLVSNLLKESLAKPAPITVATEKKSPVEKKEPVEVPQPNPIEHHHSHPQPHAHTHPQPHHQSHPQPHPHPQQTPTDDGDHKHKKDKKKKEKHKHKDRDKSKDERKKHKKDKDKEKDKEKKEQPPPAPETDGTLRITIPREKLSSSPGLKIKIPKERLAAPPPPPSGLKIKISKEVLETSRKRAAGMPEAPPHKLPRHDPHKVGWPLPPPYRPPLPYYVVAPPPPLYYGDYFYGMFRPQLPQPPLPPMPPPAVPPPPPE
ncbi:cyclin-T isoform X1 [Danaus plexippus]|uniref:cyclin-T isoform X1 n=1 Tax=Danaus plexippus TaxID=13037 RepID=UPI002AB25A8F|nr:cyclin-T isoform X1 [Danaus plexippus]